MVGANYKICRSCKAKGVMFDFDWLRDVLETLRGVLLRIKGRIADPEILLAITLTEASLLLLGKNRGVRKGADDS